MCRSPLWSLTEIRYIAKHVDGQTDQQTDTVFQNSVALYTSCKEYIYKNVVDIHVSGHRSIFVNDDQQDATIQAYLFIYLFIPSQLNMFQAMSSPIIRST